MSLYKTIHFNSTSQIYIWQIVETYKDLFEEVRLTPRSLNRLNTMKSEMQQRAFLSVRKLLQYIGYSDFDLYYDESGKPHLRDGRHISITHSFEFSAIIISDAITGIDMEKLRNKITYIADKFADSEFSYLDRDNSDEYIKKLTVIWGIKEAIFKIRNEKGISFKDHIRVDPFELADHRCAAQLHFGNVIVDYNIYFTEIENYILVYAFETN